MQNKQLNILIIDDDPNTRKTFGNILKAKGFAVEEAGNGADAVALCLSPTKFFNIALIDVRLPDASGLEVLESLSGINEDIISIMMTGYASLDTSIEAMNKGAYSYLVKPIDVTQALAIIDKAIEKQRLSMENKRLLKELQLAAASIKALGELLPICMHCKSVRDDKGYWEKVETYISSHTGAQFTHGICPKCLKKYFSDYSKTKPEHAVREVRDMNDED